LQVKLKKKERKTNSLVYELKKTEKKKEKRKRIHT